MSEFRKPESVDDAKRIIKKLKKTLAKAKAERAEAEKNNYDWGVRAADEVIVEWELAIAHFEEWLKANKPTKSRLLR
jgi:hypothetical protein